MNEKNIIDDLKEALLIEEDFIIVYIPKIIRDLESTNIKDKDKQTIKNILEVLLTDSTKHRNQILEMTQRY